MHIKLITTISLLVSALIALSGCSDNGEPATGDGADKPAVRVITTGDVESTLNANGAIFCGPGERAEQPYMFELYAMAPPQQFNMQLSRDMAVGTHPIVGSDDDARHRGADVFFYYTGPDRTRFDRVESGSIMIENVPSAVGESLIATIEAQMANDESASIRLSADLNVRTSGLPCI